MAGFSPRCTLATLAVGATLAFAACGEESNNPELLPQRQADPLLADIEAVESAAAAGDCDEVDENIESLQTRIGDLGGPISQDLKDKLRAGAELLADVSAECDAEPEAEEPDVPDATEETEAPTPEPAPEPEDTTSGEETDSDSDEQPEEEETTPSEEQPPEEQPPAEEQPEEPTTGPPETIPPADPGETGGIGPGNTAPRGES